MLTEPLTQALSDEGHRLERFRELVTRLFAQGILVREEDSVEQKLYDDARRIERVLVEYFHLAGFRLVHYVQDEYYRLYAPGAQVPGLAEDGEEPVSGLRARVTPDFVAAALALRFLYQQGLTEGATRMSDRGEVLIRLDELAATLATQLKRPITESLTEKHRLLYELRKHRLISFNGAFDMANEDALMAIRPTILGIVSDDTLAAALEEGASFEAPGAADDLEAVSEETAQ